MISKEKIAKVLANIRDIPDPTLEYNGELPEDDRITPDTIYGFKARFNKDVTKDEVKIIYHY